jgi:3-hydroxyisobutyrate dehydrogenase
MSTPGAAVGLVGLGNLGRAIGLNLVDRGWPVHVLDKAAERQQYLIDAGAIPATAGNLTDCGTICFVVPDETAIWQVLRDTEATGTEPLLARLSARHTVVVISTILPSASQDLSAAIKITGARYVEAPVTGGPERARRGELTAFLAGATADIEATTEFLQAIAVNHYPVGDVGAAAATKLANQLIMLAALGGIHEALRLTRRYGVADPDVLAALGEGTADTWVGRNWGFFDRVARDYNEAGVPKDQRPWSKDLREVIAAAESVGEPAPLARLLSQTVAEEVERHALESESVAS